MFTLREFVKDGFLKAVGKMADHQVILNAAAWHEKGVLATEDLAQIQALIEAKNALLEEDPALAGEAMLGEVEVSG